MKIVCDNCATKYSIADEKVRGKVFKIRCKKCSHIIVVRGGADGNVEASREPAQSEGGGFPGDEGQTIAASGRSGTPGAGVPAVATSAAAPSGDAVWHLVIDREQVGPLSPSEVRGKFSNGEIDVETYAWREGFGDWLRLGSIEDFRDLGGGAPTGDENATRRTDSADLFAAAGGGDEAPSDAPSGDLFGGVPSSPQSAYSSAPSPSAEADVFGGGGGGGGLFGAPSAAPAPRPTRTSSPGFAAQAAAAPAQQSGDVDVRPMTGQRNENSVLFSLNNLQALATGGGPGGGKSSSVPESRPGFANSQTEGSGLIDIRAMAASTLAASPSSPGGSSNRDDLPGLGAAPVFSPMAAPILMPAAPSGPPKWMFAILGVGVLAVVGIVIVGILLLTRKPEPVMAAAVPAATGPAAVAGAPAGTAPAAGTPAAAAPAAGAPGAVAQADKGEEKKHTPKAPKADKGGGGAKVAKNDAPATKAEAAAPKADVPAAPAPKKGGKRDELDDLLTGAVKDEKPAAPVRKAAAREESSSGGGAADESLPDSLDKGAIVGGMSKIKPRVGACFDQYKVPGMANVAVTIGANGRVSSASVTGQFAGTPTGECVAKAAKSATFPRSKSNSQSIVYPFILR